MSCIDAAIIKALVEHIGGNPDDVHTGSSNTGVDWSSLTDGYFYRIIKNSENQLIVKYIGGSENEASFTSPIIGKLEVINGSFEKFMFFPPTSKNKAFFARSSVAINGARIISNSVEKTSEGYDLSIQDQGMYTKFVLSDVGLDTGVDDFMIQAYLMYLHTAVNSQE